MLLRHSFAVLALLAFASCAGGRIYQDDAVKPVRNVAIIGIDVIQPAEFDLFKPSSGPDSGPMSGMNFAMATSSPQVRDYNDDLAVALKSMRKWNVVNQTTVARNDVYRKYFTDTTEGIQSTTPIPKTQTKYRAPDLMEFDGATKIKQAGRDEIMNALKVDAVVLAQYTVQISGSTIMGIGSRYPQTSLNFTMYRKGIDKPVWQDIVKGEDMKESIGKTAFSLDFNKLKDLSLKSSKKAYAELQRNGVSQQ
jgi:hypothetical protein